MPKKPTPKQLEAYGSPRPAKSHTRTVTLVLTPEELVAVYEAVDQQREAQREAYERGEVEGTDEEAVLTLLNEVCTKLSNAETDQL